MPEDFLVARNPEAGSTLPYLLRVPLPERPVVLKAREPWPLSGKVYCHRSEAPWPAVAEVVDRLPVRVCRRNGPAIDLVLTRGRLNRSQFVLTQVRGREAIFWQTPTTVRAARPGVRVPTRRASGATGLVVTIDDRERYPYRFAAQQVSTVRARLAVGDYGIVDDGRLVAVVERKGLPDLAHGLIDGRIAFQLADLAAVGPAAVVVEERYSRLFRLDFAPAGLLADRLAQLQVRYRVPIVFTETRPLAEEWTFRFLGAAAGEQVADRHGSARVLDLPAAEPLPPAAPTAAAVRTWAAATGVVVADRGRVPAAVLLAYAAAHGGAAP